MQQGITLRGGDGAVGVGLNEGRSVFADTECVRAAAV